MHGHGHHGGSFAGALLAGALVGTAVAASSSSCHNSDYFYEDSCSPCSPPPVCSLPVATQPRPVWMPDSASSVCTLPHCMKPLSMGNRHHCRACGALICSACSRERLILRSLGYSTPERVCDRCVAHFRQPLVPPPQPQVVYQAPVYQAPPQPQPVYQAYHVAQSTQFYHQPAPQFQPGPPPPYQAPPQFQAPPPYQAPPAVNQAMFEYAKPSAPPL